MAVFQTAHEGSIPFTRSNKQGRNSRGQVPERPIGAVCKTADLNVFAGSNPALPTKSFCAFVAQSRQSSRPLTDRLRVRSPPNAPRGCGGTGRHAGLRDPCQQGVEVQPLSSAPKNPKDPRNHARLVELADTRRLGRRSARSGGSSPSSSTNNHFFNTALWCSGNTDAFGASIHGSNP
jgi:hypothetical protein